MKPKVVSREDILAATLTLAGMGIALVRGKKSDQEHDTLSAVASAVVTGHRAGTILGHAVVGPAGHVVGVAAGCVAGCIAYRKCKSRS